MRSSLLARCATATHRRPPVEGTRVRREAQRAASSATAGGWRPGRRAGAQSARAIADIAGMVRMRLVCLGLLVCAAAPALLLALDGRRMIMMSAGLHFGLVAVAAGVACVASVGLTLAGARARDGRAVLLGTAFSTMTALFAVHALATPGILVGPNGLIALAGGLSMPVGAGLLALTALPPLRRPRRLAPLLAF